MSSDEATMIDVVVAFLGVNAVAMFMGAALIQDALGDEAGNESDGSSTRDCHTE